MLRRVGSLALVVVLIAAFVQPAAAALPPQDDSPPVSPFQQAVQQSLQERIQAGLPVPTVAYTYRVETVPAPSGMRNRAMAADQPEQVRVLATTTLAFDNPQEAGYPRWPALEVDGTLPDGAIGTALPGDYSELVRQRLAERFPGIWEHYTFGQEPRRYTYDEVIDITYPAADAGMSEVRMLAATPAPIGRTGQNIIFGWEYPGPNLDYTIGGKWEVCFIGCVTVAEARAGFALDWNAGLRLPTRVNLDAPALMLPGNSYELSAALEPLDWNADDYARAGLLPENGNEFVLRFNFFFGAKLKLFGVSVINWGVDVDFNRSRSFATPFGPGTKFPLPVLNLPPSQTGLNYTLGDDLGLGVGLNIEPILTSDRIEAAWDVVSQAASGNGSLTFSAPSAPVAFGPVTTSGNGASGAASIRLRDLRYWFSVFKVQLSGYLQLDIFGFGARSGNFSLLSLDLSSLTNQFSLGTHSRSPGGVERRAWVAFPPATDTFTVNRTDDTFDTTMCQTPTSPCTLRAAIIWANQNPLPNTIIVPAGAYVLTLTDSSLIGNVADYGGAIHNGQYAGIPATLLIDDNCLLADNSAIGGGGLFNDGHAEMVESVIGSLGAGNTSTGVALPGNEAVGGGGIGNWGGTLILGNGAVIADNLAENGAAIQNGNGGVVTIQGARIYSNTATLRGGGLVNFAPGTVNIQAGSRFDYNRVRANTYVTSDIGGGAIYNFPGAVVEIEGASFTGNSAVSDLPLADVSGGAIHNEDRLSVSGSTFSDNRAHLGGAIFVSTTLPVVLRGSTLDSNVSLNGQGGGLYLKVGNVTLEQSSIIGNSAIASAATFSSSCGGGIMVSNGELSIIQSVVDANETNIDPGNFGYGGGLCNQHGTVQVRESLFSNNLAGGKYGGVGAGLFNSTGTLSLINSTVSGNQALYGGGKGGGIANDSGLVTLTFVTLSANSGAQADSIANTGTFRLRGTILAGSNSPFNCVGSTLDDGHNLQWPDASCGASILIAEPQLGALADNGGFAGTHALLPDSPAIDAIPSSDCWHNVIADQRQIARPQGPACDIGAYELVEIMATATPGAPATMLLPPSSSNPGFAGRLIPVAGPLSMIAAAYTSNPMPISLLDAGGGVVDLRVPDAGAGDQLEATFYYPLNVQGISEQRLRLWYLSESGWQPVLNGSSRPSKQTGDYPDGLEAGGRFRITFNATSVPPIIQLHGTVFAMAVQGADICGRTLDTFNRADGPIGTRWAGARKDYRVAYEQGDVTLRSG